MKGKILAFGEIMLRLSAIGNAAIEDSTSFNACYGGTEANVLACLSNFGHEVKYLTALPDNGLGDAAEKHLHSFGIDTSDVKKGGDTLGMYFVQSGDGSRGSKVLYNRRHAEITRLDESSFDYDKVFDGVGFFHISGISFALSKSCSALAFRLIKEAKQRGITVSFDFNYRPALWSVETAGECFRKIVNDVDIVLASSRDLSAFLGVDEKSYFEKFGNRYLVLRNRTVLSKTRHSVNITLYKNDGGIERFATPEIEFDVQEKIGGGDAFDGGMIHALTMTDDMHEALRFALSAFILKHSVAGDTFTLGVDDVKAFENRLEQF